MRNHSVVFIPLLVLCGSSCGSSASHSATPDGGLVCSADVGLSAWVSPATGSGVTVFGTTAAASDVTVRAVYVGTESVPLTTFNFRTWSVAVSTAELEALQHGGTARLPVVAFTSVGCQQLTGSLEPAVALDAGRPSDAARDTGTDGAGVGDARADRAPGPAADALTDQ